MFCILKKGIAIVIVVCYNITIEGISMILLFPICYIIIVIVKKEPQRCRGSFFFV